MTNPSHHEVKNNEALFVEYMAETRKEALQQALDVSPAIWKPDDTDDYYRGFTACLDKYRAEIKKLMEGE